MFRWETEKRYSPNHRRSDTFTSRATVSLCWLLRPSALFNGKKNHFRTYEKKEVMEWLSQSILDTTDDIMSREIIDTYEVAVKKWLKIEKEWSKSYEYANVEIIKSEANQFFKDIRSKNFVGKTGILTRFDLGIFQSVFRLEELAKEEGFSGVLVCITFKDRKQVVALIEEIRLLKDEVNKS